MEILRSHLAADTSPFEQLDKLVGEHERRTGKGLDVDVKIGVALTNMTDADCICGVRLLTSSEKEEGT